MKVVLFDLGKTLEDRDVLLPGARETLQAIQAMRSSNGDTAVLTLRPSGACFGGFSSRS